MKPATRQVFLLVTSVLAATTPVWVQAAEVRTTVQTIPSWSVGDGHLAPRTISVSKVVHKRPQGLGSLNAQVASNVSPRDATRVK